MSWLSSAISTVGGAIFGGEEDQAKQEAQTAQREAQRYEDMLDQQREQQNELMETIAEGQEEKGLDNMEMLMIGGGFLVVLTIIIMFMR